jgi:ABC-type multidrug transport system fused ATPase/permease subunit
VRTLTATTDVNFGIGLCFAYLAVAIILSAASQCLGLFSGQLGSRVKARLAALVAEHALLHAVTSQSSQALALTLASSDAHLVYDGAMAFHYLWAAPVEAVIIIALLIYLADDSGWIAAGIVFFIVTTMYILSIVMTRIRGRFNAVQSKQVTLFFEVLQNMRPFRFYGWDAYFLLKLNKLTDEMAPLLLQLGVFKSLNLALVFACPPLMAIAIFGYYTKSTDLPATIAFTTLSLFNTLRFPLVVLPNAVRAYSSASTAYNRIREFLNCEKAVDTRVVSQTKGAIEIENLPVGPNKTILANWKAQPGELWVFQGPVRSYKSTLIETIAGHYPIPSSACVRVGGRVSYAMQQPWMQQATIKDNIVCCEPWNEERYKQVLFACALTPDLSIMPLGDETPVAEKGISLSGGQRQRVALARAVYRIADIYLLDNPISALDDQTQEHIWTHLFEGLLQSATVIVGSSRPVISCTAVLNLSTNGVSEGDSSVTRFDGPVVASASAKVPPRYSRASGSLSNTSAMVASQSSVQISHVTVNLAPNGIVQTPPPSPTIRSTTPVLFRSRIGSLKTTIEEAAVGDVSKEVAAYAVFAEVLERAEADAEGGNFTSSKQLELTDLSKSERSSFRARTGSFLEQYQTPSAEVDSEHRALSSSMRERIGSRRANFSDLSQNHAASSIFTGIGVVSEQASVRSYSENESSVVSIAEAPQHSQPAPPNSPSPSTNNSSQKQKHGLLRWAEAGNIRIYLLTCMFYPLAQGSRIISDFYVRWWTEKEFFSSQQKNLEVYSWLVGGWVCSTPFCFPH